MKKHVLDFLMVDDFGKNEMDDKFFYDQAMMKLQFNARNFRDLVNEHQNPNYAEIMKIDAVEEQIYQFLENQNVDVLVSANVSCEAFCIAGNSYSCVFQTPKGIASGGLYRTTSIAHELGHYLDFKHNFNLSHAEFGEANKDYHLLEAETIAWKYAMDILTVAGFEEWDYFDDLLLESLETYTDDWELACELFENMELVASLREKGESYFEHMGYAIMEGTEW